MKTKLRSCVLVCLLSVVNGVAAPGGPRIKGFCAGMPKNDAWKRFQDIVDLLNAHKSPDASLTWMVAQGQFPGGGPCNRVYIFRSAYKSYVPGPGNERDARGQFVFNQADEVTEIELESECVTVLFNLPEVQLRQFADQFEEAYGLNKSQRVEDTNYRISWNSPEGISVTIGSQNGLINYFRLRFVATKERIRSQLN